MLRGLGAYRRASQYDPTRTLTLRNQFVRALNKRFREFRGLIRKAIIDQDCFGLASPDVLVMSVPQRKAFAFTRSGQKVSAFMNWLGEQEKLFTDSGGFWGIERITQQQIGAGVEDVWTNQYVYSAYQRGIARARQEMMKAGYPVPSVAESGGIDAIFNSPMHIDRVGLLYSRVFSELKGITATMDTQISRVLAQGMAEGRNPRELAKLLTRTVSGPVGGLGITDTLGRFIPAERRAQIMARTEIIRAHHQATVQEYRNWKLEGVEVQAEWETAGDRRVCPECDQLQGQVFTLDEIEKMIPVHPQCRCIALPVDMTGL